jgi:hypothetical protein
VTEPLSATSKVILVGYLVLLIPAVAVAFSGGLGVMYAVLLTFPWSMLIGIALEFVGLDVPTYALNCGLIALSVLNVYLLRKTLILFQG